MTLHRTIKRRETRKRAKQRPKASGRTFVTPEWVIAEQLQQARERLELSGFLSRDYKWR